MYSRDFSSNIGHAIDSLIINALLLLLILLFCVVCKGRVVKVKVKEVDLYSAFIEVPYTQGAQVRITQCYVQTTPYLPLPRKHSPDGASQTEVADI